MKKKNRLIQFGLIFVLVFAFAVGQKAFAAAVTFNNGGGDFLWSNTANWSGAALPTAADDVTIGDATHVLMDGNGATYTIQSLTIGAGVGVSYVSANVGDTVSLVVAGNITVAAANDYMTAVNGTGRINVEITAASTITPVADYVAATSGLSFHDLTITDASVSYTGDFNMRVTGDFTVAGTSAFTGASNINGTLTMYGGSQTSQAIDVSASSYCEFVNLTFDNSAVVTTAKSFTVTEIIDINDAGSSFIASADTIYLDNKAGAAGVVSPANGGGTLSFNDLFINGTGSYAPAESYIVKGNFIKVGAVTFTSTEDSKVTFTNTAAKQIICSGGAVTFGDIEVSDAATVRTYSDFNSEDAIAILGTGVFEALGGTITKVHTAANADAVTVAANGQLIFNNLSIADVAQNVNVETITITGNLTFAGANSAMIGQAGDTVIFDNDAQKTINASTGTLSFANVKVTTGSDVTTATAFTMDDQGANSQFWVEGTGSFTATAQIATFTGTAVKTIIKDANATLLFNDITIADAVHSVTTASDFEIGGTALLLAGAANGSIGATAGTITMSGDVVITAPSASRCNFNNLIVDDAAVTVTAGDFVEFIGDLTINGSGTPGSFIPAADATTTFNGTTQQTIGGNSTATIPASFGVLVINKTVGTVTEDNVLLACDIGFQNTGALTLTDGFLKLGSQNLTLNGTTVTVGATNQGAINGDAGTVILTGNANTFTAPFDDDLFTPDVPASSDPTLYNLTVAIAETVDGTLTINGNLLLDGADLTTTGQRINLYGNLAQTAAGDNLLDAALASTLCLRGTGTVTGGLQNSFFNAGWASNLIVERAEILGGALEVRGDLGINTGVNYFDIYSYTLTMGAAGSEILMTSGSIDADLGTVVLTTPTFTELPANVFKNNTVSSLTLGNREYVLNSDLIVTTALTQGTVNNIYTKDNTLTIGPSCATLPAWVAADHVIGTLTKTVTNSATTFNVGDGAATSYRPLTLQFKNPGSSQVVTVTSEKVNPVYGRGGDPTRFIQALWTISTTGTAPGDSLTAIFGWGTDHDNSILASFEDYYTIPARWDNTAWRDYSSAVSTAGSYAVGTPHTVTMTGQYIYAIDDDSLSGEWAVFDADPGTAAGITAALATNLDKVVITDISPNPVASGFPFTITAQLQDQYGNPKQVATGDGAQTVSVVTNLGSALTGTTVTGVIPEGSNSIAITGVTISATNGSSGNQLKATVSPGTYQAGISEKLDVIADLPASQANTITLTTGSSANTSLTMGVTSTPSCIVVARAGSAISDLPADGTTYIANSIFGAGSIIGDGAVVYKGTTVANLEVTGLAPNTTYHFRAFAYNGSDGNEKYMTFPAANNPKSTTTSGTGVDDDVIFGSNDTWATSKTIGTNASITGTINSSTDDDWFNFSVTDAAPNIKIRLTGLPADYNIEIYDENQVMIRRGIRTSTGSEGPVINALPPGTYTVKVYGKDGVYSATDTYTLKVTTKGSEIYSITP